MLLGFTYWPRPVTTQMQISPCLRAYISPVQILRVLWTHMYRAAEYEADAIGVHLLAKACYDPDANITMLQKLQQVQDKQGADAPPELLSTHPLTQVGMVVWVRVGFAAVMNLSSQQHGGSDGGESCQPISC